MPPKKDVKKTEDDEQDNDVRMSFCDLKKSMHIFTGDDTYPIDEFLDEFEDTAQIMKWSKIEKLIYAKSLLYGTAKLFLRSFGRVKDYNTLKEGLIEEFDPKINSASIHKEIASRKMKTDATIPIKTDDQKGVKTENVKCTNKIEKTYEDYNREEKMNESNVELSLLLIKEDPPLETITANKKDLLPVIEDQIEGTRVQPDSQKYTLFVKHQEEDGVSEIKKENTTHIRKAQNEDDRAELIETKLDIQNAQAYKKLKGDDKLIIERKKIKYQRTRQKHKNSYFGRKTEEFMSREYLFDNLPERVIKITDCIDRFLISYKKRKKKDSKEDHYPTPIHTGQPRRSEQVKIGLNEGPGARDLTGRRFIRD